ncbi:MAG TPA: T9SS type A sorting domain-containing protein [Bacteroidales bacterium]|nr:T9SS type A sorting domain-containing protein [Bacteroidales bacterium]
MKKSFLFFLSILISSLISYTSAQQWMRAPYLEKTKSEANFYDIQKAFYKFWGDKPYERSKGYKQFKRWEYDMQPKCFPDGKIPDPLKYYQEYKKFLSALTPVNKSKSGTMWTPLGLNSWTNGNSGYNPGNGRLNAVTVDMNNRDNIYVAAPSGGIWATKDGGMSWNTTFDTMPVLGTSTIAIHPQNPDIIYIGTGDRDAWDTKGTGIYKSIDGGSSWTATGLHYGPSNRNINKIIINPLNPDRVFAACNNGIYSTKNGGTTWQLIYNGSEVKDLKYKPNDTTVIYGSGPYFVRSANGGSTFTKNTTTLPHDTVRIELDVTAANPDYVYVVVSRPDNTFEGVYRSDDAGLTFIPRCNAPNILGYSELGDDNAGQAWYDLAIAVSPNNANEVFVGGVNVWKSMDGGQNFAVNTMWYTGSPYTYIHCDIHSLNFYGDTLYCGSDGGIFYTADHGNSWLDISTGLGIAQFYGMGSCESAPYTIAAGAQDIGSNVLNNGQWTHVFGADGMEAIVNNFDPQNIYVSYQSGGILKSSDGGNNFDNAKPYDTIDGGWFTPYVMDPNNGEILYAGFQEIYKTTDGAASWTQVTNNLTNGFALENLAVAPSDNNYIYASESRYLYVTTDGGSNWSTYEPSNGMYITGIAVDPDNPQRLWLTLTSSYNDKVLFSADAGSTFSNITGNLTSMGFNCIAYQKNANDGLYVGTEIGIFFKDSTMAEWIPYNYDLPNVKISELEINYSIGMIRAATYGRGIWEAPLYNCVGITEIAPALKFEVYPNPAKDMLNIRFEQATQDKNEINLFNVVGTLTKQKEVSSGTTHVNFDVSHLAPGTYFLKVSNSKGSATKKVVIAN